MSQAESKKPILEGGDILFECRHCGKSLSIDSRGAGLNIRCPQCDRELEVPIPDGFDLAELDREISDSVASDAGIQLPMSDADATALSAATQQIDALKTELEALRAQRPSRPYQNADLLKAVKAVHKRIEELCQALDELGAMLDVQAGPDSDETQKIG